MALKAWNCPGLDDYEVDAWIERLGSPPVCVVASGDHGDGYDTDQAKILELANGRNALVTELGCSCYESSDADIDLHPTLASAEAQLVAWERRDRC